MNQKSLLKLILASIAIFIYAAFVKKSNAISDLSFKLDTVLTLSPLLFSSSQLIAYFMKHMFTYFKHN